MRRTSVPFAQTLPGGLRVRLRLPQRADRAGLAALGLGEMDISRALRFDPRERFVVCATAWVEGAERLVAFGTIALREEARPATLVADPATAPALGALLEHALIGQAEGRLRRAA